MTVPAGDSDFSGRWRRVKSLFTRRIAETTEADQGPGAGYCAIRLHYASRRPTDGRERVGGSTPDRLD